MVADSINGPQLEIVTDKEAETQRGGQKSYLDSGHPVPSLAFSPLYQIALLTAEVSRVPPPS